MLFHLANASLLPLVGQKLAAAYAPGDEFDTIHGSWSDYRDSLLEHGPEDYRLDPRHEKEYSKREQLYQLATGRDASIEMLWHLFKDDAAYRELKPKTTWTIRVPRSSPLITLAASVRTIRFFLPKAGRNEGGSSMAT